jgi:hypothetical protein
MHPSCQVSNGISPPKTKIDSLIRESTDFWFSVTHSLSTWTSKLTTDFLQSLRPSCAVRALVRCSYFAFTPYAFISCYICCSYDPWHTSYFNQPLAWATATSPRQRIFLSHLMIEASAFMLMIALKVLTRQPPWCQNISQHNTAAASAKRYTWSLVMTNRCCMYCQLVNWSWPRRRTPFFLGQEPWSRLHKKALRPPKNSGLTKEVRRRAAIDNNTMPGPRPSNRTRNQMIKWLEENLVCAPMDV